MDSVLSGGSDGERLIVILASHFCAAVRRPGWQPVRECVRAYLFVCVRACTVGLVRACMDASVRARVRVARSNRTHFGGAFSLTFSLYLSHSLFLKLPHHAAPVDWRYSHIYYAGG